MDELKRVDKLKEMLDLEQECDKVMMEEIKKLKVKIMKMLVMELEKNCRDFFLLVCK